MKPFLIPSLLLLVSLQFGCAEDRERGAQAASEVAMSDGELEQRIQARINANPALADVSVDADADRNSVTLKGKVETDAQRNSAAEVAQSEHPGVEVSNQIEVKPREVSRSEYTEEHARSAREKAEKYGDKLGSSLDDAWIHTKITTKLIGDRDTSATEINVDVNNNAVTLRGTVDSADEKAEAGRIAKETEGVTGVRNLLKVSSLPKS